MDEQRAKDLARIEPPSSMRKIVEFAEQLSFSQDALFSGTDLPKPRIGQSAIQSQEFSARILAKPYSIFPGAGGESFEETMSRSAIRTRDIQEFTRWLVKWEDKYSELRVYESPEQYFLHRATPEMIESFEENPEVRRVVLQGRRRRRVVEEQVAGPDHEETVVQQVEKPGRTSTRRLTEEIEAEAARDSKPAPGGKLSRRGQGGTAKEEADYGEYWRESAPRMEISKPAGRVAAAAAAGAPMSTQAMMASFNQGLVTTNVQMGSLTGGLLRGRADATSSYQAQEAATQALQQSPVAPHYLPPQQPVLQPSYFPQQPGTVQVVSGHAPTMRVIEHPVSSRYPSPEVSLQRGAPPMEIYTDYPGAPEVNLPPQDYVIVPREAAKSRGLSGRAVSPAMLRGAAVAATAALMPVAFAAAPGSGGGAALLGGVAQAHSVGLPGFSGAASQMFATQLMGRSAGAGPVQFAFMADAAMPAGSLERKNLLNAPFLDRAMAEPMVRGMGSTEAPVKTPIPANPLLGQITIVSQPMRVASQDAERAGAAVSIDVRQIAKGTGALDATGLAMLKQALPPGAQAIYPAVPQGSLGPQAVNLKLAPSLLNQILETGYGPGAGAQVGPTAAGVAAGFSTAMATSQPLEASLVPGKRPTDEAPGLLGTKPLAGPGALGRAGEAGSQRGGALDFLGMPVRLAPSLSGNPDAQSAAEARRVLPAGAAAMIRPNEFQPLRQKLMPSFGTVNAEPDKAAWQKAAPSFGLRDAAPHTILSPDARLKPPSESASVPQLEGGGHSAVSRAIGAATVIPSLAAAAPGPTGHGQPAHFDAVPPLKIGGSNGAAAAFAAPQLHGHGAFGGATAASTTPLMPGGVNFVTPGQAAPTSRGGFSLPSMGRIGGFGLPSVAASAAGLGSSIAARNTMPLTKGGGQPASPSPISMASPGTPARPGMTALQPGTARMSMPAEKGSSTKAPAPIGGMFRQPLAGGAASARGGFSIAAPSMVSPAVATTAAARSGSASLSAPSNSGMSMPRSSAPARGSTSTTTNTTFRRAPEMPIAASVMARPPQGSSMMVQRAEHGRATLPANEQANQGSTGESKSSSAVDPGAAAQEVNQLATEVWSVLKRRLRFEAERLGRI